MCFPLLSVGPPTPPHSPFLFWSIHDCLHPHDVTWSHQGIPRVSPRPSSVILIFISYRGVWRLRVGNRFASDTQRGLKVTSTSTTKVVPIFVNHNDFQKKGLGDLIGVSGQSRDSLHRQSGEGWGGVGKAGVKVCTCLTLAFTCLGLLFASYREGLGPCLLGCKDHGEKRQRRSHNSPKLSESRVTEGKR